MWPTSVQPQGREYWANRRMSQIWKKNYAFISFLMMLNWLLRTPIGCSKCEWILSRLWSKCSGQLGRSCRRVKTNNISASSFSQFLNHPISNWIEPALEGNKVEPLSLCFCFGKLQTINSALALSPWCKFRRKDDTRLVYAWPPINTWCFLAAPHMVAKTKHAALMSRYYDLAHSVIMKQFEACWSILVSVGICEFQERSRRQRP